MSLTRVSLLILSAVLVAAGCQEPAKAKTGVRPTREAPPPLANVTDAFELAGRQSLAIVDPEEHAELHNVYHLSEQIVSGGEPLGADGMAKVAAMGVKTILSVDGKIPDREAAARHGMRYVHVPIQYRRISGDELLKMAKMFRELDGPFYIHCFHGRHRGPAAAAVGRLVLDGASREQALAEMRQWCGASGKYEGLYRTIATATMPTPEQTQAYEWDFPAAHRLGDFRQSMVGLTRHWDNLELLGQRGFEADPAHPDLDAVNEAKQFASLFEQGADYTAHAPEDFNEWMQDSVLESKALLAALERGEAARAKKSLRVLKQTCVSCHASYRND